MNLRLLLVILFAAHTLLAQSPFEEGAQGPRKDFVLSLLTDNESLSMQKARAADEQGAPLCPKTKTAVEVVKAFAAYRKALHEAAVAARVASPSSVELSVLESFEAQIHAVAAPAASAARDPELSAAARQFQRAMLMKIELFEALSGLAYCSGHARESVRPWSEAAMAAFRRGFEGVPREKLERDVAKETEYMENGLKWSLAPAEELEKKRVRVSSGVIAGQRIDKTQPTYPPEAKSKGIQGTVDLKVLILEDGSTQVEDVLHGDPLLVAAAVKAVRQFRYRPYFLKGWPVKVETRVVIRFDLR